MAVLQGEFCAFRAKPNGRYIEVAVLQRAGIARVYCNQIHFCTRLTQAAGWGCYAPGVSSNHENKIHKLTIAFCAHEGKFLCLQLQRIATLDLSVIKTTAHNFRNHQRVFIQYIYIYPYIIIETAGMCPHWSVVLTTSRQK